LTLRRAPAENGSGGLGRNRGRLWTLGLLLAFASIACETRHRSAVPFPDDLLAASSEMASAGIRRSSEADLDEVATRLLTATSGSADRSNDLTREDRDRLLAEPFRLAYATAWRHELRRRIGHRRILIGELGESRIETRVEWLPIFLVWVTIPFELARRSDVPHPVFELRLVDLEEGRIDAEFFAMLPRKAAQEGLSAPQLESALAAMGLRGRRP
jgi:hypothetical protein